jgi:hypothetical protein
MALVGWPAEFYDLDHGTILHEAVQFKLIVSAPNGFDPTIHKVSAGHDPAPGDYWYQLNFELKDD